jgi:aryl-alcohol dehydrogenase-like predicted oxidoreductase
MADALGLGVTAWQPLGAGLLTGKYDQDDPDYRPDQPKRFEDHPRRSPDEIPAAQQQLVRTVRRIAGELAATPAQVALAWLRSRVPHVIPIVGARTAAQLDDSLGRLHLDLGPARQELDDATAIESGFPHDLLSGPMADGLYSGIPHRFPAKRPA